MLREREDLRYMARRGCTRGSNLENLDYEKKMSKKSKKRESNRRE